MIQRIPDVPKPLEKATSTSYVESLFTDGITFIDIPNLFHVHNMKMYEDLKDPQEYIAQYKQWMFIIPIPRDLPKPCMCKRFGLKMTGPALQWFVGLPNGTINFFVDLMDAFNLQFASSR